MASVMVPRAFIQLKYALPSGIRKIGNGRKCVTYSSAPYATPCDRKLILYSKKDCCLCDSLKEKLSIALMLAGTEHSLSDVQLEVRDITNNPKWEEAYRYEIPVLARLLPDGSEEIFPRMSPRISAEQVHKKLAGWLSK